MVGVIAYRRVNARLDVLAAQARGEGQRIDSAGNSIASVHSAQEALGLRMQRFVVEQEQAQAELSQTIEERLAAFTSNLDAEVLGALRAEVAEALSLTNAKTGAQPELDVLADRIAGGA